MQEITELIIGNVVFQNLASKTKQLAKKKRKCFPIFSPLTVQEIVYVSDTKQEDNQMERKWKLIRKI